MKEKEKTTLAYLGPEGTYTHEAAQFLIANSAGSICALERQQSALEALSFPDIPGILEAVGNGSVTLGIIPAENSIEGAVNLTLDLLAQEPGLFIRSEVILAITHHLLSFTPKLSAIHTVLSHYQALAQCRHFLKEKLPRAAVATKESTAEAVRFLTRQKQTGIAAIGSQLSHLRYQVPIIANNIGDYPHNRTSFLLIGRKSCLFPRATFSGSSKTTFVVFPQGNRPGELYQILGVFARYRINLSKIISRPNKKQLGHYLFWLDCDLDPRNPVFGAIIDDLKKETNFLKILGSYPVYNTGPDTPKTRCEQ